MVLHLTVTVRKEFTALMHAADEQFEVLECSYRRLHSGVVSNARFIIGARSQDAAESDDGHVHTRHVAQARIDAYTPPINQLTRNLGQSPT